MSVTSAHRIFISFTLLLGMTCQTYAGDPDRGASVYYEHGCYSCHGYNGTGKTPLANNVSGIMASEDTFLLFLRQRADRNPVLPDKSMPNYAVQALSDEQAVNVYAYIKTLTDDPPKTEEIPTFVKILEAAKTQGPDHSKPD
ncbi:MAG: cytochrome c [Gammaproteobacteria bacterium]|nr:cytochrome c [Gammaproteobacteria bacterium]